MLVDSATVLQLLGYALANFPFLMLRASATGVRDEPIIAALAYLVLVSCHKIGTAKTSKILSNLWDPIEKADYPEEVRKLILRPVLRLLLDQVRDVCTSDCERIMSDRVVLSEADVERYWKQLTITNAEISKNKGILLIENREAPCKVGFPLGLTRNCPLCHNKNPEDDVPATLKVIQKVSNFRQGQQKT
jgi:hypothetical protein